MAYQKKSAGIHDFPKVADTQLDDVIEVEEFTTEVDLTSRLAAMEKQNAQIFNFLGSLAGRAALPSSGSNPDIIMSTGERT